VKTFRFCLVEVSISLNFPLDVLEFSLELLLGFNTLHQHDLVILIHLVELDVHIFQGDVLVLLMEIFLHVFFDEVALGDEILSCLSAHYSN
jgi:hypothetical protein